MNILSLFTGSTPGVFSGKVVAFTGTLQSGSRKILHSEAQRIVTERDGHAVTGEYGKLREPARPRLPSVGTGLLCKRLIKCFENLFQLAR